MVEKWGLEYFGTMLAMLASGWPQFIGSQICRVFLKEVVQHSNVGATQSKHFLCLFGNPRNGNMHMSKLAMIRFFSPQTTMANI